MKQRVGIVTFLLVGFALLFSCSDSSGGKNPGDGENPEIGEQLILQFESGDFQSGFYGDTLDPLIVKAVDENGVPLPDVELVFKLQTGKGLSSADDLAFSASTAITDEQGLASVVPTLGQTSGMALVDVRDQGNKAVPLIFRLWSYHPVDDEHKPLCILEINDFHMRVLPTKVGLLNQGGLARIATVFKDVRRLNDLKGIPTLIVNTGDDFENTLFHNVDGAISTLYEIYDEIGVDILQIGNHDYHFGVEFLDKQVREAVPNFKGTLQGAPMTIIWGSVDPGTLKSDYQYLAEYFETDFTNTDNSARYNQTVVLDFDGMKIGLLGAVTDAAIYTHMAGNPFLYTVIGVPTDHSQGLEFFNPDPRKSDYIANGIDSLDADGVDAVIVTSHAGLGFNDRVNIPPGKDELIARYGQGAVSGRAVDLVLSAHSHIQLNHPIVVENPAGYDTYLTQGKEAGLFVASLALEIDTTQDVLTLTDNHLIQIDDTLTEDADVVARIEPLKEKVLDKYGDVAANVVGEATIDLSSQQRSQSGLGQIIADSSLWKLKQEGIDCDVAMSVPSMYRADMWKGPITEEQVYDIVPLHKLDGNGVDDETLVILEMVPGLYDFTIFGGEQTKREQITVVEYVLELVYSIIVLDDLVPGDVSVTEEFKLEVTSFADMGYQVDTTGPYFHRIVPGSVTIGGQVVDSTKSYRLAMTHSLATTLSYIFNTLVDARDADDERVLVLTTHGAEEIPYIDTDVLAWTALRDYLKYVRDTEGEELAIDITGDRLRSVQPDVMLNPSDISWDAENPTRGETVEVTVAIHNLGDVAVDDATIELYYESTPWDLTDNYEENLLNEGFSEAFKGSLIAIEAKTISVGAYPLTEAVQFSWTIPTDMPAYDYPLVVMIKAVESKTVDDNTGEPYVEVVVGNNNGPDQSRRMSVY